jgi:hypothetical protein
MNHAKTAMAPLASSAVIDGGRKSPAFEQKYRQYARCTALSGQMRSLALGKRRIGNRCMQDFSEYFLPKKQAIAQ